jgi:hypothetical protein
VILVVWWWIFQFSFIFNKGFLSYKITIFIFSLLVYLRDFG